MKKYKEINLEGRENQAEGAITIGDLKFKLCKNIWDIDNRSYHYSVVIDLPVTRYEIKTGNIIEAPRDTEIDVPFNNSESLNDFIKLFEEAKKQNTVYIRKWNLQPKRTLKQRLRNCCLRFDFCLFNWKFKITIKRVIGFRLWVDIAFIHIYICI